MSGDPLGIHSVARPGPMSFVNVCGGFRSMNTPNFKPILTVSSIDVFLLFPV
eukprot:SAG31_NODE_601_length_13643_cov_64.237005_5_plen_52_part_00